MSFNSYLCKLFGTRVLPSDCDWTIVPQLFLVYLLSRGCVAFCVCHTSWRWYSLCAFSQCLLSSTLCLVFYCILLRLFRITAEKWRMQFFGWLENMIVVFLSNSFLYAKLVILQSLSTKIYPNLLDSFQCYPCYRTRTLFIIACRDFHVTCWRTSLSILKSSFPSSPVHFVSWVNTIYGYFCRVFDRSENLGFVWWAWIILCKDVSSSYCQLNSNDWWLVSWYLLFI